MLAPRCVLSRVPSSHASLRARLLGLRPATRCFAATEKAVLLERADAVYDPEYAAARKAALEQYQRASGQPLHPMPFRPTLTLPEFRKRYESLKPGEKAISDERVVGRIAGKREASRQLIFYDLEGQQGRLQVLASAAAYADPPQYGPVNEVLKRGDVVGAEGRPARTQRGELSLGASRLHLLAPCRHHLPLPGALQDPAARAQLRHVDLLANGHAMPRARAAALGALRALLHKRGFLEVETPVLWPRAGGAAARPFQTRANAADMDLFLRIAPELQLKQLVVGGLERVFEVGKQFRNEGIDATHNPEFTTVEAYQAHADVEDMMQLTEAALAAMAEAVLGRPDAPLPGHPDISLVGPFDRVSIAGALPLAMGRPVPWTDEAALRALCQESGLSVEGRVGTGALLDRLVGHYLEPRCRRPTFLTDHPLSMSPLAAAHPPGSGPGPGFARRFELLVAGQELCNAYAELTDPDEQRRRFAGQAAARAGGDMEAPLPDEHFCRALEWGLPPTAGWGLGVDRLLMLLTGRTHIRDVLLFPL